MKNDFARRLAIIKTLLFLRPIVRLICKPLLIISGIFMLTWIFNLLKLNAGAIISVIVIFILSAGALLGYDVLIFNVAEDDIDVRL